LAPVPGCGWLIGAPLKLFTKSGSLELFGMTRNQPALTMLLPAACACAAVARIIPAAAASAFL